MIYPCDECGKARTSAEGGTVFTLCDACWARAHHALADRDEQMAVRCRKTDDAWKVSESWRVAELAWQQWAATLLRRIGRQLDGGLWGDEPARRIIGEEIDRLSDAWVKRAEEAESEVERLTSEHAAYVANMERIGADSQACFIAGMQQKEQAERDVARLRAALARVESVPITSDAAETAWRIRQALDGAE